MSNEMKNTVKTSKCRQRCVCTSMMWTSSHTRKGINWFFKWCCCCCCCFGIATCHACQHTLYIHMHKTIFVPSTKSKLNFKPLKTLDWTMHKYALTHNTHTHTHIKPKRAVCLCSSKSIICETMATTWYTFTWKTNVDWGKFAIIEILSLVKI